MNKQMREQEVAGRLTRRRVVKAGARLAYAAPLVAASFKFSGGRVRAVDGAGCCVPTKRANKVAVCHGTGDPASPYRFACVNEGSDRHLLHLGHEQKGKDTILGIATVGNGLTFCPEDCGPGTVQSL